MSTGEKMETDAALVEKVAKGLYEADRDHEATWPLNDDDDGSRGDGAYVRVTPREVVEEYRQHARDALKVVPPLLGQSPNGRAVRSLEGRFFGHDEEGDPSTGRNPLTAEQLLAQIDATPFPASGWLAAETADAHETVAGWSDGMARRKEAPSPATVDVGELGKPYQRWSDVDIVKRLARAATLDIKSPTDLLYYYLGDVMDICSQHDDTIRSLSTALETERSLRNREIDLWLGTQAKLDAAEALARDWEAVARGHSNTPPDVAKLAEKGLA